MAAIQSTQCTASSNGGALTAEQLDVFRRDGYLVIPDFFDARPILSEAQSVVRSFDPSGHPMTKFSTGGEEGKEKSEHVGDRYFLESGDKIRFFLEEGSIDQAGRLNRAPELCVNKCGHGLHALNPVFYQLTFSSKVQDLIKSLDVFRSPQCLQSMIICKQPSIGGAVPAHNDSTFLYTSPPSAVGLWFALEDCTPLNGCLSFMPGSHRKSSSQGTKTYGDGRTKEYGPIRGVNKRFVRSDADNLDAGTTFISIAEDEEERWDDEKASMTDCKAGTLVLIHGSVLHKSEKNQSGQSRFIYTFHCIEGDPNTAQYDERNWLQPTQQMPFSHLFHPPALAS